MAVAITRLENAKLGAKVVLKFTLPLFRRIGKGVLDFEGTGVLLEISDTHRFLVSAAHVFDALKHGIYLLADGRETEPLQNNAEAVALNKGQTRENDPFDVGFVRLTDAEVVAIGEQNFVRPYCLAPRDALAARATYFTLGYPQRDQTRLGPKYTFLLSSAWYACPEAEEIHYKRTKLRRESHVLLVYNPNRVQGPKGIGPGPSMVGYSGAGVWRLSHSDEHCADNPPKLVGIFLGKPKGYNKALVATRIHLVLEMLRSKFPEVSEQIPVNSSHSVVFNR